MTTIIMGIIERIILFLFLLLIKMKIINKAISIAAIKAIHHIFSTFTNKIIESFAKAKSPQNIPDKLRMCEPTIEPIAADIKPLFANEINAIISGSEVVIVNNKPPADLDGIL